MKTLLKVIAVMLLSCFALGQAQIQGTGVIQGQGSIATGTAPPPVGPTVSFSVSPTNIPPAGSATLSWTTTGATAISIDQGVGSVAVPSGSQSVSPTETTPYTLTATGPTGTTTATAYLSVSIPQTGFWSGILDPSRATDWTVAGVQGGIPNYPACNQTFSFPNAVTGNTDTVSANGVTPTGIIQWQPDHAYNVGDLVADQKGNVEKVSVAGTSRGDHPIWPTTAGGTVADQVSGSALVWTMSLGPAPATLPVWQPYTGFAVGAQIVDSNGNIETAGPGGTSAIRYLPPWLPPASTPTSQEHICDVGTYPACGSPLVWLRILGGTDSDKINRALFACKGTSTAVVLAAGTFIVTYGVSFNPVQPFNSSWDQTAGYRNVVLRGSGPKVTKLMFWGAGPCASGNMCAIGSLGVAQTYGGPIGSNASFGAGAKWVGTNGQVGAYNQGATMVMFGPAGTSTCVLPTPSTCVWDPGLNATAKAPQVGTMLHLDQRSEAIGICPVDSTIYPYPQPPTGTNFCQGVYGASEQGTTVTIQTTIPHGFQVGDCVGIAYVGVVIQNGNNNNAQNGTTSALAYNSLANVNTQSFCWAPTSYAPGWFRITAVPTPTSFQYTSQAAGLPSTGNGFVTRDTGGLYNAWGAIGATTSEGGSQIGRSCGNLQTTGVMTLPQDNRRPMPTCQPGEMSWFTQDENKIVTGVVTDSTCPAGDLCYTVDPPIYFPNWRTSQAPGAWFTNTGPGATLTTPSFLGVENLTADFWNDGSGITTSGNSTGGFKIQNYSNSWIKNTRLLFIPRDALWMIHCSHISIVENYIYGSKGLMSTAYGFEVHGGTSLTLIANNICQRVNGCHMTNQGSANVMAYNFHIGASYAPNTNTLQQVIYMRPMIGMNHEAAHYNLWEGNVSPGSNNDNVHGASMVGGVTFRNRWWGNDYPTKFVGVQAMQVSAFNRAGAFIGNIMGIPTNLPGAVLNYSVQPTASGGGIWNIGMSGSLVGGWCCQWKDQLTDSTFMRWGNWDPITNAVRWCGDTSDPGWTTVCSGVQSATYVSGGTVTGAASGGYYCQVQFSGGNPSAFGFITMSAANVLTGPIVITDHGMNYSSSSPPTTATLVSGYSNTCTGTIQVNAVVGGVSEVPTTPATFLNANPVPANHNLPPSFAYASQPGFFNTTWGTPGWPLIGPDVTSSGSLDATCLAATGGTDEIGMTSPSACNGVGHYGYMNPAQICFHHSALDPAYQQSANITSAVYNPTNTAATGQPPNAGTVLLTLDRAVTLNINTGLIITGVNPPTYNGTYLFYNSPVPAVGFMSSNQISYAIPNQSGYTNAPGDPGPWVSGGTVTWPNIRLYDARDCYPSPGNYALQ